MSFGSRYPYISLADRVLQSRLDLVQIFSGVTERAGVESSERSIHIRENRAPDM